MDVTAGTEENHPLIKLTGVRRRTNEGRATRESDRESQTLGPDNASLGSPASGMKMSAKTVESRVSSSKPSTQNSPRSPGPRSEAGHRPSVPPRSLLGPTRRPLEGPRCDRSRCRWGGMKAQLSDTEASCYSAKWGDRHEYRLGIRQVKSNALHYFVKKRGHRSIVSDDMYQHGLPPARLAFARLTSLRDRRNYPGLLISPIAWRTEQAPPLLAQCL